MLSPSSSCNRKTIIIPLLLITSIAITIFFSLTETRPQQRLPPIPFFLFSIRHQRLHSVSRKFIKSVSLIASKLSWFSPPPEARFYSATSPGSSSSPSTVFGCCLSGWGVRWSCCGRRNDGRCCGLEEPWVELLCCTVEAPSLHQISRRREAILPLVSGSCLQEQLL